MLRSAGRDIGDDVVDLCSLRDQLLCVVEFIGAGFVGRTVASVEDELRPHLERGEKLLWAGRPVQGVAFTLMDWYLIPFSVVWLGMVLRSLGPGLSAQTDPMIGAVGVLFVAIGIYILVGRYIADWLYRSHLIYGVTDRRAIIVSGMFGLAVQTIDFTSLGGLKLEERPDGSGTISFGTQMPYRNRQQLHASWGVGNQFFRVQDVKIVYAIVRDAMQRQRAKN